MKPISRGRMTASEPGRSILFNAAAVEISTHLAYSGLPVPSMMPGMVRNWRRTSSIISFAASPTASMANAEKRKGIIAPTINPVSVSGSSRSMLVNLTACAYEANKARAVSAADAMANPLAIAAVVFPTASSLSVTSRTLCGNSDISAMPPALSDIGPYASTATVMPVVDNMPTAAKEMP